MGLLDWLLRKLQGKPPKEEEDTSPLVPPEEIPRYTPPPRKRLEPEGEPEDCGIEYIPGRKEGRIQVQSRWRTQSSEPACIRELFNEAGIKDAYSIIICGEPCSEYPGHEGEEEICLTYKFAGNYIRNIVNGIYANSLEFANTVNEEYGKLVECWETVVEIAIIDN